MLDLTHAHSRHLHDKPWRKAFRQRFRRLIPDLENTLQNIKTDERQPRAHSITFHRIELDRRIAPLDSSQNRHISPEFKQIETELRQILAIMIDLVDACERARDIFFNHALSHPHQRLAARNAEHLCRAFPGNRLFRKRDNLIHRAERITHAAARRPRDQAQRRLLERNLLLRRDTPQMRHQIVQADALEIIPLTTAHDRDRNLVRVCRRKNKHDMRRRLLKRLQQRVERLRRQHVHFVDDVNLIAPGRRRIAHGLKHLADFVNASVGRTVDLDDIHRTAFRDLHAIPAHIARLVTRRMLAVERFRKNPRRRSLAHAARTGEQKRMRHTVLPDRIPQRLRDMLLPHKVFKFLRTPLPGKHDVRHKALRQSRRRFT